MITFLALALIMVILAVVSVIILAVGGSAFILIFGDLIVCIAIIVWIIKHFSRRKSNRIELNNGLFSFSR